MRRSRIISSESKAPIQAEESFSFFAYLLKLWLYEPLYLPALRATFFQKKAFRCVAYGEFVLCRQSRRASAASDYDRIVAEGDS